jgi:hypothetical protein
MAKNAINTPFIFFYYEYSYLIRVLFPFFKIFGVFDSFRVSDSLNKRRKRGWRLPTPPKKKKNTSKLFDSSLLRYINIILTNMSTISATSPNRISASVRGSQSLRHGRQAALSLSRKKTAFNFRENQFEGSTRALKARLSSSNSKMARKSTIVRAEKVVGIDLGTTNSAVRYF